MSDEARYEAGLAARRRVLGGDYVASALAEATDFDADWQRLLTEFGWGTVWTGEALDDRQRSLNTLCLLAALNRGNEFRLHLRGALRNGCSVGEIRETLVQVGIYAGMPAAVEAFRIAREVLADVGPDAP